MMEQKKLEEKRKEIVMRRYDLGNFICLSREFDELPRKVKDILTDDFHRTAEELLAVDEASVGGKESAAAKDATPWPPLFGVFLRRAYKRHVAEATADGKKDHGSSNPFFGIQPGDCDLGVPDKTAEAATADHRWLKPLTIADACRGILPPAGIWGAPDSPIVEQILDKKYDFQDNHPLGPAPSRLVLGYDTAKYFCHELEAMSLYKMEPHSAASRQAEFDGMKVFVAHSKARWIEVG